MLYNILYPLANDFSFFNLFKYITFRTGGAFMTSLIICFIFGPMIIRKLKNIQTEGQPIREDGPKSHLTSKKGTPTMGGIMILLGIFFSTILWADISNPYISIVLFVTIALGIIGFLDDYKKLKYKNAYKGVSAKNKLMYQFLIAFIAMILVNLFYPEHITGKLAIPFFKNVMIDLGIFYIVFALLVIVGASNAVNLTDGLDGLASVPVAIVAAFFLVISYLTGNIIFANYLQIIYVPGIGEIAVLCGAMIGGVLGFLWFNAPPAQVFMGDTGSLSLGGALGIISVITKNEIVLAIVGGLFVAETLSVIIQVASFKLTGKRIFKMSPLHHHFEHKGWSETTIVVRFWIIAVILGIIGLATLKLR